MAINTLSLPVDVPWKRLAISADMYAKSISEDLPVKWRSSLAVFSYDPKPEETPELESSEDLTTFLKVVATITGYQPEGNEIDQGVVSRTFNTKLIENYEQLTSHYYPALSALVQVAVFPHFTEDWAISEYPHIADFEPKKRELVELVSETGEALTQSSNSLNVRKGNTSTDSTEFINIDRGSSFGVSVETPYGGGGVQGSSQKEVGTRSTLGSGTNSLINTDASREKRESYSHTTSLSQLYHLLDSYHSGTNRILFFLNARPHVVDSPYTFVKGPRRLEGIQEFFLVVRRPKAMAHFCVKAVLETAHLHVTEVPVTTGETKYDQGEQTQTFTQGDSEGLFGGGKTIENAWTVSLPAGYRLDRSRGGGSRTETWEGGSIPWNVPPGVEIKKNDWRGVAPGEGWVVPTITTYDDHVDIKAKVKIGGGGRSGFRELTVTVYYISIQPTQTPTTTTESRQNLFLTARQVNYCSRRRFEIPEELLNPYVTFEKQMDSNFTQLVRTSHQPGLEAAVAANAISRQIHNEVISSFRSSRRYAAGDVDFIHTRFALSELFNGVKPLEGEQLNTPLYQAVDLSPDLLCQIEEAAPDLTIRQALQTSPEEIADLIGISTIDVRRAMVQLLGVRHGGEYQPFVPTETVSNSSISNEPQCEPSNEQDIDSSAS